MEISYKEKLKKIFGSAYVETNKNHNQVLDVYEKYCDIKKCKLPVLVNYDTHIDAHIDTKLGSPNIAQWVNFCFPRFGVTEYYWLLPNYFKGIKRGLVNKDEYSIECTVRHFTEYSMLSNVITNEMIYRKSFDDINKKNRKYGLKEFIPEEENFIPITIYIVPFNEISVLKDKEIVLSVDADAFCNTGYDTKCFYNNVNITKTELKTEFNIFVDALYENNIKVKLATLTRSPGYFPDKYEIELTEFYKDIKHSAQIFKVV